MRKKNGTGKRLRLTPLIVGSYGALLGLGLVATGLFEITDGIGMIRVVLGLGMAGFGLLGIWDGVRDLVRPEKKAETLPPSQFILTDISGIRSSLVTPDLLRKQMDILAESEEYKSFYLQILPPLLVEGYGRLQQIFCVYHYGLILVALFALPESGQRIYQKSTEPDVAEAWLKQLLAGCPDFSGWEPVKAAARSSEDDLQKEETESALDEVAMEQDAQGFFLEQLLTEGNGQITDRHKRLVIFKESWHDEHQFFSYRDVELAVEGVHAGTYEKIVLEWGSQILELFPGVQDDLMILWRINQSGTESTGKENIRFLAREGTVTQVNFWLVHYLDQGYFAELSGWTDVTALIEKEQRRSAKKHGKLF